MGVTGLWRLIEPSGTLVPLQTLDNKVLAVDVSIWLHQAIKGFQNAQGGTLPNAHLLGIYHRICKLLFFGIKPVVIFDGGVPQLKQQTIFQRASKRSKALSDAETIRNKLVSALLKHTAIGNILSDETKTSLTIKPVKEHAEDIYHLPPTNLETSISSEEDETSTSVDSSPTKHWDLHTIDEKSAQFKALPVDVRHDILTDLKETRKQSSWGRLHELPKQSDDFSGFQMKRLLKRYSVQVTLEEVEKEMGGRSLSLAELESLLKDQGVAISDDSVGKRIASDESKRYLLIKDLKKAMDEAKQQQEILKIIDEDDSDQVLDTVETTETVDDEKNQKKCDIEFENNLKLAIELSLQDAPSTSKQTDDIKKKKLHELSFLQDFDREDFLDSSESEEDCSTNTNVNQLLASAKNYMVEYSGLTPSEIAKIMNGKPTKTDDLSNVESEKFESDSQVVIENSRNKPMSLHINSSIETTDISKIVSGNTEVTLEPQTVMENNRDEPVQLDANISIKPTEISKIVSDNIEVVLESQNIHKVTEEEESDASDDFVEVSDRKPIETTFEIVVKPEDELEDDLFSDVFKRVEDTPKISAEKPNLTKLRELITDENEDVEIHAETGSKKVTEEITPEVVESRQDKVVTPISREQLQEIRQELQLENAEMVKEQLAKERMANSLSEQIVLETQDLLRLFGIPYVVAPMEAEAQCAFLEIINLTDGTITDDSDIWLFGGKTVYKNFFNQQKHVLEFRAEKIQEHYKLSREQMILLALLVGSDYTLGLQGIGPVTALEILGSFPSSLKQIQTAPNYRQLVSGLIDFRQWLNGKRTVGLGRQGLRSKLKNVSISDAFPNLDVVRAYLEPNVDLSKEQFSWGKPNIEGLIDYAKRKFGWSRDKSEGILKPVLKSIQPEVQKSIKHYFKTKHKIQGADVENKMSKRVKKAVETMEKGVPEEDAGDSKTKTATRRTRKKKEELPCELSSDEDVKVLRKTQEQTEVKLNKIQKEVVNKLAAVKKVPTIAALHKKEVIPQKQKDKANALKNKIKAIETFRKSKQGPGFVKPRKRQVRAPKADAELSESSSD